METDEETVSSSQSEQPVNSDSQETLVNSDEVFNFPGGGIFTYKYIERYFTLNDLAKIELEMTNQAVTDILGAPNGTYGSDILYQYYVTYDKACVVLFSRTLEPDSTLSNIYNVDPGGRWYELQKNSTVNDDIIYPENSDGAFVFPGGVFCTYEYIERDITLGNLAEIKIGMTYQEVKDILVSLMGSWVQVFRTHIM